MSENTFPPPGTPGGHIGGWLIFAYCEDCCAEWVWTSSGIPPTMTNCGCDDEHIVVIRYHATSHGRLGDE